MMPPIHIRTIGLIAPGMPDWPAARSILTGRSDYRDIAIPPLSPASLPANERRRATPPTRLALEAARQATDTAGLNVGNLTSVFASSDGDLDLIHRLCLGIAQPEVALSPTQFHNSVHNAVAGYWSIGTECRAPSTSIAAGDGTVAAGLIECATQLASDCEEILLVVYDLPAPPLLDVHRPIHGPFACALLLARAPGAARLGALTLALDESGDATDGFPIPSALEPMCRKNPAGRLLPLLAAIALGTPVTLRLPYLGRLRLRIGLDTGNQNGL